MVFFQFVIRSGLERGSPRPIWHFAGLFFLHCKNIWGFRLMNKSFLGPVRVLSDRYKRCSTLGSAMQNLPLHGRAWFLEIVVGEGLCPCPGTLAGKVKRYEVPVAGADFLLCLIGFTSRNAGFARHLDPVLLTLLCVAVQEFVCWMHFFAKGTILFKKHFKLEV